MTRPDALLRAGFPYLTTIGMRRITHFPVDIAIGEEDRLYTLLNGVGATEIRRFNWDDENLGTIGGPGTGDGQFKWPSNMVRDHDENLMVTDQALHRISTFDKDGQFLGKWGEFGEGEGQLNRPSGIALDADENVFIVDTMNHRVQKFTKSGVYLMGWGTFGDGEGQFNMPWGITVDEVGDVYVADWRNDRIQKLSSDGEFIFKLGSSGGGEGQFSRPSGVAVDADGDIYVADWGNDRVQQFDQKGRYVDKFIGDATLSKSGKTYILANFKTLRLREMTSLEPAKRLRGPASVKLDDQGRLYITDYLSHRVQVYQKEAYALGAHEIMEELRSPTLTTT